MIDWSLEKIRKLTELVSDPESYSESKIASIMTDEFGLDFSRDAVHNKISRLNLRSLVEKPVANIMPYYNKYKETIEGLPLPKVIELNDIFYENRKKIFKILYLGDLHIPFQVDEQIQTAVNRNLNADCVVTTEVADCYSISRFNKYFSVPFEVEVDNIIRYFEFLHENFPLTFVVLSNHDRRVPKEFVKAVPPALLFLVEDNLLKVLAKPFPSILVVDQPYFQINDAVFTHAEYFSTVDMKAGSKTYSFITEWQETIGFKPFHLILQAHSHMMGCYYKGGGIKVMEGGCMTLIPDYAVQNFYSKPQTNGYIVVIQHEGITDLNLTREYVFDTPKYIPNYNPVRDKIL